ncbi:MAG: ABC transporter ATP-binding protein [Suipraeoptans sp.]
MKQKEKSSFAWLYSFVSQCKGKMTASVLLAVGGSACGIVPYFAVAQIIIKMIDGLPSIHEILPLAVIALVGYLGKILFSTLSTILSHRSAFSILQTIRKAISTKLSRVPMGFILDTPSGKFKSMLVDTVEKLELPLAHMIPELTGNILIPIFMFIYMFTLDWRIALIALVTVPVGVVCYMGMLRDYETRYNRVLRAGKGMDAAIVEYIGGIQVIKAFNQSASSYEKYTAAVNENYNAKSDWFRATNSYYVAGIAIMPTCLLGVLPLGTWLYYTGGLEGSTLIILIILSMGLVKPLIGVLEYTDSFAMVDSTLKEIAELLTATEMKRPKENKSLVGTDIELRNVCFGYKKTTVLHDVSFRAKAGHMTAIVGPSGSGKSTVAKLIASFWEADSGSVMLSDIDMRELPLDQVMEHIAYVSQDNFLFHLSIKENIRMGRRNATDADVEAAAKAASCHDFIMTLSDGYDTNAGDSGGQLSGGERQRIAIARAILKDAPIVILDEATAFTDPENEAVIQHSINNLVRGKTLIVIAHRLSTITGADNIVVMDTGRVNAQGTHEQLLEHCPLYSNLWYSHIGAKDKTENEKTENEKEDTTYA